LVHMVRFRRNKDGQKSAISDEDIEGIVEELRYVLKTAAISDDADRRAILDLTKTIEELTERRIDKMRDWDPAYGKVAMTELSVRREALLRHLEEAKAKLPEKPQTRTKRRRRTKKEDRSLRGILSSLIRRLGGSTQKN
jgi:tRNA C32,U32 (ribose-2'-O)-methylase TrmJ